jgi:hypothetical protein
MENKNNERFFEELAKAYTENENSDLERELLDLSFETREYHYNDINRKSSTRTTRTNFRKFSLKFVPLAASLIIVVFFINNYNNLFIQTANLTPPASSQNDSAPSLGGQVGSWSTTSDEPSNTPAPGTVDSGTSYETPNLAIVGTGASTGSPGTGITVALQYSVESFCDNIPDGYSVTGIDYDNLAAIVEIMNDEKNRIVLMAEEIHDFDKDGFSRMTIHGSVAYILQKSDYCVLKFTKDEVLYTLTSLYGQQDLIKIAEII